MIKNKLYIIISAIIICFGLIVFGLSNRYYIDSSTKLKVDRLTGKTYQLNNSQNIQTATNYDNYYNEVRFIIKNLEFFKNDPTLHGEFITYYNNIVTETKKDPLYYQGKMVEKTATYKSNNATDPFRTPNIKYEILEKPEDKFTEYGRTFFTVENIAKTTTVNQNIKTPDDYINYVINYYKNQLPE